MELESERLLLREFTVADWPAVNAYTSDAEVVKYMAFGPTTEAQAREHLSQCVAMAAEQPRRIYELAVVLRPEDRLIGTATIALHPHERRHASFSYLLNRQDWGHGYATEAMHTLINFGFGVLKLHQLDLPRRYQTIPACGVFGIGVSRAQDFLALQRFHQHLVPGGVLLLEHYLPYEDAKLWPLWRKEARAHLPEAWPETIGTPPTDDHEYELHYRLVSVDPLEQQAVGEMRTLLFKDKQLVVDETRTLTSNYYFHHEMRMLLEQAGFRIEAEKGDWTEADATADHDVIVYVARK